MFYPLVRNLMFRFDAEAVHNFIKRSSKFIPENILHRFCHVPHPCLRAVLGDATLENPIGMAAGFDKNAELIDLLWGLGFGFVEIGSITAKVCAGNQRPRIFRLVEDFSLINRMGLPNHGAEKFARRLSCQKQRLPVGINIAKTPGTVHTLTEAIDDIVSSLRTLQRLGAYTVINLSCPNTDDPRMFEKPENLEALLCNIGLISPIRPILLKLSPDLEINTLRTTVDLAIKHDIDGFVLGNTTNQRPNLKTGESAVNTIGCGGLSGAALKNLADAQLKEVFDIVGRDKILIASGGIMNFQDLLDKLERGASLFQVYSGLIYNGPFFVKRLNQALAQHCEKLGVKNYAELVGQDHKHSRKA